MAQETANADALVRERAESRLVGGIWSVLFEHPLIVLFFLALVPRLVIVGLSELFHDFVLDDGTYHHMATAMASGDISGWDDFTYSLFWRTATFLVPITAIYKVFGPNMAYGQIFVAFVGTGVALVVYKLAREVVDRRWALVAALIIAWLPSQAFWSAQLMKDAAVWLTLSSIALAVAIANRSKGWRLLAAGAGVALGLCALSFLREHTLVVAAWATLLASIASVPEQRMHRIAGGFVFCVTIPWVVAAIGPAGVHLVTNAGSLEEIRFQMARGANTGIVDTTPGGTEEELNENISRQQELEVLIAETTDPRQLAILRRELAALRAEQSHLQGPVQIAGEGSLDPNIRHIPRGISVMLLEPFPLPFEGSSSLRLARLESLIWYPLLILGAIGLWAARSRLRALAFPLVAGGGILMMYALTEGNVGTAHRHRGEFVWVVAVLAALGAQRLSERRRRTTPRSV